jgi:hypothetical protein
MVICKRVGNIPFNSGAEQDEEQEGACCGSESFHATAA